MSMSKKQRKHCQIIADDLGSLLNLDCEITTKVEAKRLAVPYPDHVVRFTLTSGEDILSVPITRKLLFGKYADDATVKMAVIKEWENELYFKAGVMAGVLP